MKNAAFASMRVRMWERDLLSQPTMERMIESPNLDATLGILRETRYGKWIKSQVGSDLEQALSKEMETQAQAIQELVQDTKLLRLLFLPYDIHNLKIAIKASTDPERFTPLFFSFGTVDREEIREKLEASRASTLPTNRDRALQEAAVLWQETQDAQQVDLRLDQCYYEEMKELAADPSLSFFSEIAQDLTDFTNVLTFFRALRQDQPKHFIAEAFLTGGKISFESLWKAAGTSKGRFEGEIDGRRIAKEMRGKHLSFSLLQATEHYLTDGEITMLEKARDEFLLQKAEEARRVPEGPEVIFSYLVRVEKEIQNLHIILSAKRVGMEPKKIRQYVRTLSRGTETEKTRHA